MFRKTIMSNEGVVRTSHYLFGILIYVKEMDKQLEYMGTFWK